MLRMLVSDLLADPGERRTAHASLALEVSVLNARVDADTEVEVTFTSLSDGLVARGRARAPVELTCNRCLTEWSEELEVPFEQVYRFTPQDTDEELPILEGAYVDLAQVVHDEVSLALPLTPLCQEDCQGLCPTCGTDLNTDPCGGHGEDETSPFAALKQLFET